MKTKSKKTRNNNIERERVIAREELANAALRMRQAADDVRLYLSEEGVFADQLFLLERAARTGRGAARALEFCYEKLGQLPLSDFVQEGEE